MSTILVIDAEECIRYTFKYFLTEKGYEVHTAQNYEEALSLIKYYRYDLIFLDTLLEMRQCLEIIRTLKRANNCPIVVITAAPDDKDAITARAAGVYDYLPKPLLQEKLLQVTSVALRRKESDCRFSPGMVYAL
ncbi:MAG: response regulator [Planctomycetes bacterium]|nr:response regulator [Planctomycetota bacterium]